MCKHQWTLTAISMNYIQRDKQKGKKYAYDKGQEGQNHLYEMYLCFAVILCPWLCYTEWSLSTYLPALQFQNSALVEHKINIIAHGFKSIYTNPIYFCIFFILMYINTLPVWLQYILLYYWKSFSRLGLENKLYEKYQFLSLLGVQQDCITSALKFCTR